MLIWIAVCFRLGVCNAGGVCSVRDVCNCVGVECVMLCKFLFLLL